MYQSNYRVEFLYGGNPERPADVTVFVYFNNSEKDKKRAIGVHTGTREKCAEFAFHLMGRKARFDSNEKFA